MINNDTHRRFWVVLQKEHFELLSQDAQAQNLSPTALAGQVLAQYIEGKHPELVNTTNTPEALNEIIVASLAEKSCGVSFTIKDLFPNERWQAMTRSEKAIAAKILAAIQRKSEDLLIVSTQNKTSIYEKKGGEAHE